MAKVIIERLIDDMGGGEADESVRFGLDGRTYTIDLTEGRAEALRGALAPFIACATPDGNLRSNGNGSRVVRRTRADNGGVPADTVRKWALGVGKTVSLRGRVSNRLIDEYKAAH